MSRRNLTEERTAQILDAFERCVVRLGLGGTSLEAIAREAGVQRSILRHYVGNRDDLVLAMARRFSVRYREQLNQLARWLESADRIDGLLDALFSNHGDFRDVVLVEALLAEAESRVEIRDLMRDLVEESVGMVRDHLRALFPARDARSSWSIASGVVGLWFQHASLAPLRLTRRHATGARRCARILIESLEERVS